MDSNGPVLLVGYAGGLLVALAKFLPERSIVVVEDPDIVRKRDVRTAASAYPTFREVIECDFQAEGAADAFYHRHVELAPSAVIPISDYAVPFAARLAERFALPGATYGAGILLRDKHLLRGVTAAAGIPNPESVRVDGPGDVAAFMAGVGGPVVLKPANRRASVGIKIVFDPAEVEAAWTDCMDQDEGVFAPDRPLPLEMLAERRVVGEEFSVEMLVRAGRPIFSGTTRKFLFDGPRPVELGHLHPADIDDKLAERLVADTVRVVDAVGMSDGIVHCEWIVEDGVPYLVECAGRMAGDGIIELVMVAWQYDIVEQYFRVMRGLEPTATPPDVAPLHCAVWLPAATPGEIVSVEGVDEARSAPGVHTCAVSVKAGDTLHELRSSWDRIALVTAEGATAEDALRNAQHAAGLIKVSVR